MDDIDLNSNNDTSSLHELEPAKDTINNNEAKVSNAELRARTVAIAAFAEQYGARAAADYFQVSKARVYQACGSCNIAARKILRHGDCTQIRILIELTKEKPLSHQQIAWKLKISKAYVNTVSAFCIKNGLINKLKRINKK